MKSLYISVLAVAMCAVSTASEGNPPNLNGVWHWIAAKSMVLSPPNDVRVKFDQNGPDLLLTWRLLIGTNELMQTSYYRIGSVDNRSVIAQGVLIKSGAKWEGSALAIDSISESSKDASLFHELWSLSKDGHMLMFKGRLPYDVNSADNDSIVFERQADDTWGPPREILPAGQIYQNIQIIKEPAWRLPSSMMSLTRWLGVDCSYCHTLNEFDRDDKEPKKIARQMYKLVHDVNEKNFPGTEPGNYKVTCWTCHRGNIVPQTSMPAADSRAPGR